jgi:maltose O-acetyltransferase
MGKGNRLGVPLRVNGYGSVRIGSGNSLGYGMSPMMGSGTILIQARTPQASITIGEGNLTSNNISIVANDSIAIGDHCQMGDLVAIYDSDFHEINPATRNRTAGPSAPVRIGNNVWLGSRVMVLKGVSIGDNSVIAAMSVVTRSVPPNSLAAGIPAKVIRSIG